MAPPPTRNKPTEPSNNQRNEYIPSYISKKPFYVPDDDNNDYLEHQRLQQSKDNDSLQVNRWYDRGKRAGPAATKFRKGACTNCGSMTHNAKDCLSRPRKQGAKWTGKDIQADEVVQNVELGWDAKRDRWNGYDASEYKTVIDEYNAMEEAKKNSRSHSDAISGNKRKRAEDDDGSDDQDSENLDKEEAKYEEETDMGRQQPTSTRNLRIREDTAKYLLNLDLDSAKYDPKTRSMVDSGATADNAAALVAEEGFMRASGDAAEFERAQRFAWDLQERGDRNKIHLQANPTSGEFIRRRQEEESKAKRESHKKELLEKYGGQQYLKDKQEQEAMNIVESENFVEYDEKGGIKGAPKQNVKSSYAEDVMVNNHTSVWGSWWKDFTWGYACCHSTVKNSYCTGETGRVALETVDLLQHDLEDSQQIDPDEEPERDKHVPNGVEDDRKASLDLEERRKRIEAMRNGGMTEEEVEQYQKRRALKSDPMANYLGAEETVH